jgi:hypothetical protein
MKNVVGHAFKFSESIIYHNVNRHYYVMGTSKAASFRVQRFSRPPSCVASATALSTMAAVQFGMSGGSGGTSKTPHFE